MKANRWLLVIATSVAFGLILVVSTFAIGAGSDGGSHGQISPQKAAVLTQVAAQATAAAKGPHAPKHYINPPASCPRTIQTGIYPNLDGSFHENLINVASAISSQGVPYAIYAGTLNSDPQQGILIVMRMQKDPCAAGNQGSSIQRYLTPSRQGALTLTKIADDTVVFKTASGGTGQFNYVTGQFLPN